MGFVRVQHGNALRHFMLVMLTIFVVICSFPKQQAEAKKPPRAQKGILDLRDWDFHSDGPVSLSGEWAFYWRRLIGPEDFQVQNGPQETGYIGLPGSWNGLVVNGQKLSGVGYGTYRLEVLLKRSSEIMAFRLLTIGTAFRLIVNGKTITSAGTLATTAQEGAPDWRPHVATFRDDRDRLRILIQVSNFHHHKGGVATDILLGLAKDIQTVRERHIAMELFLSGSILIMGLYHLFLFACRRKDKAPLHFGVFCLLIAMYTLLSGERFFAAVFPESSWALRVKLTNLTSFMSVPVFLYFLHSLYPNEFRKTFLHLVAVSLSILSAVVLLTSAIFYTRLISVYHIITLLAGLYSCFVLIAATWKRREGAPVFLIGFSLFFIIVLNDVLYDHGIIHTGQFIGFGLFVFILSQSVLLSMRFSGAFNLSERQQEELQETNESLSREITERKLVEKAMAESEEKYRLLAENVNDNIWIWDLSQKKFSYTSPSIKALLGYAAEEFLKLDMEQLLTPASWRFAMSTIEENMALEQAGGMRASRSTMLELELLKKNGSSVWVEVRARFLRDEAGRLNRILGVTRDITVRKRAESLQAAKLEAEASSKAKSEFLAIMSHELRTPLNHIIGFTELVADRTVGDLNETQKEYLEDALSSSRHLLSLINDVLDLSKVEAGKMSLDASPVELAGLLKDSLTMLKDTAMERSIHLDIRLNGIPETIRADQRKLRQIVYNLLANAVKFTPDGGKVILSACPVSNTFPFGPISDNSSETYPAKNRDSHAGIKDFVEISVQDTGIGIAPTDLDRIFKPFGQVQHSKNQRYPGTGLGLSLTRSLVGLHGGRIWAESEGHGKGATFRLVLPVGAREVPMVSTKGGEKHGG
jgi:PAS domain S-box-containing protein